MNGEYLVRIIDLPCDVKGLVAFDEEGVPNIYINARLNEEQQHEVLKHELDHIERDDAYNELPIQAVELRPRRITT